MNNDNYLRTPIKGITLGEWSKTASGVLALKVKKPKTSIYEIIPVPKLIKILSSKLDEKSR